MKLRAVALVDVDLVHVSTDMLKWSADPELLAAVERLMATHERERPGTVQSGPAPGAFGAGPGPST